LASRPLTLSTAVNISWPMASRLPQRISEAAQSSAVTALPSWKLKPSRSTKVQVLPSAEVSHLSTICGWGFRSLSIANSVS
jgi:hypothetical protein